MIQGTKSRMYTLLVALTISLVFLFNRVALAQDEIPSFDLELSHFTTEYRNDCASNNQIEIYNQQATAQSLDDIVLVVMDETYRLNGITIEPNETYQYSIPTFSNLYQQFETLFVSVDENSRDELLVQLRPRLMYVDPTTNESVTIATADALVPAATMGFSVFDTILCGTYIHSVDMSTGDDGRVTLSQMTIAYDDEAYGGLMYEPLPAVETSFTNVIERTALVVGDAVYALNTFDMMSRMDVLTSSADTLHLVVPVTIPDGVKLVVPETVDFLRLVYLEEGVDEMLQLDSLNLNTNSLQVEPTAVTLSADSIITPFTLHLALLALLILTGSTVVVVHTRN